MRALVDLAACRSSEGRVLVVALTECGLSESRRGMGQGLETYVAVRGREATEAAYDAIDFSSDSVVQPPWVAAAGWWLICADIDPDHLGRLTDALRATVALMVTGSAADLAGVTAFEPGIEPIQALVGDMPADPGLPPSVNAEPRLEEWIVRWSPRRVSVNAQHKLWSEVSGGNGRRQLKLCCVASVSPSSLAEA